jgi:L-asparaginase/Glu-tRNA(Gln) amidotransferase subunit D
MTDFKNTSQFLILTTGGTIASTSSTGNDKRYQPTEKGQSLLDKLIQHTPSFKAYDFQVLPVKQMDSKDMQIHDFMDIHDTIIQQLSDIDQKNQRYNSVTVLCGTDNMENLAYFLQLSLHLKSFKTPIILTGAMLPASSHQFDGLKNLRDAILWGQAIRNAQQGKLGNMVYSAMNGQLISPYLQRKKHTCSLSTFNDNNYLGLACESIWPLHLFTQSHPLTDAFNSYFHKELTQFPFDFKNKETREKFSNWQIEQIDASFDQPRDLIKALRFQSAQAFYQIDALIINGTGNGTYPSTWDESIIALQQAQNHSIPIIRASQCNQGDVDWQIGDSLLAGAYLSAKKIRVLLSAFFTFSDRQKISLDDIQAVMNESVLSLSQS